MSEKKRIPELDGLRVIMIFIVSWYHIWQQSWLGPIVRIGDFHYSFDWLVRSGYVWVDGTVLLSAFLMVLPLARQGMEPRLDAADFFRRKAKRILPGYYFIIIAVFFGICLPWGLYGQNGPYLVKDLATHFTFTFPFWADTYISTPLGAASWTLAIIVQGYALFPLLYLGLRKHPALTLCGMAAVCLGFRAWCLWALGDYSTVVNQLINFLDVYAIGFLGAMVFARMEKAADRPREKKRELLIRLGATAVFALCLWGTCQMLKVQASSPDHLTLQGRQMMYRPVFALGFCGMILSAPFCLKPLRWVLGNRVMRFLAGISMNYYLAHQVIIVHMRRIGFPASVSDTPHMAGEQPWQNQYTFWAFALSLLAAVLITYGIEKPAGRLVDKLSKN